MNFYDLRERRRPWWRAVRLLPQAETLDTIDLETANVYVGQVLQSFCGFLDGWKAAISRTSKGFLILCLTVSFYFLALALKIY